MSESRTPEEFPLVTTLLRENIQDLHQDIREQRQESRQHTQDLQDARKELKQDIQDVRDELQDTRKELKQDIQDVRDELQDTRKELKQDVQDLSLKMDARFSKLTTTMIAVASVIVAAIGALATVLKG
jgi:chromosome segregation ATPase